MNTFRYSLRPVVTRPIQAALLRATDGPLAFLAGERLGAVTLLPPHIRFDPTSGSWAIAVVVFSAVVRRVEPGRSADYTRTCQASACGVRQMTVKKEHMRRLVVGCGYLGQRVARIWRRAGDEVHATTRGHNADALSRAGLRPLIIDVTRGPLSALPVVDTVVFAVGRDRRSGATMVDIHVEGLRTVLDALPEQTGRVIYISSTGVYAQDAGEWVDEESVCEPIHQGGKACLSAERLLFAHTHAGDGIVLRLAGVYGPGRVPRSADVTAGRPIAGSPDAYLNLIHVNDAARAVVAAGALGPGTGRTYVVSDGNPPRRAEYIKVLATQLGTAPPVFGGGSGLGKRVRNDRAVHELGVLLQYPSYREGLAAS